MGGLESRASGDESSAGNGGRDSVGSAGSGGLEEEAHSRVGYIEV